MSRFGSRRNPATLRRSSGVVVSSGVVLPTTDLIFSRFASAGVTDDGGGPPPEVTDWAGDYGPTASQATAADRPTYEATGGIDGGPTIAFGAQSTGGAGHLEIASAISASASPYTFYFVCNINSNALAHSLFGSNTDVLIHPHRSGAHQFYDYGGAAYRSIGTPTTGPQVQTWQFAAPTGQLWRGRSSLGTATWTTDQAIDFSTIYLGANTVGGQPLDGDLEAVLIYAAAHNAAERAAVWDYLASLYPSAGL